jgi:FixJ family two-component response regulator
MRAVASGAPLENQFRLRRADGAYRWFYVPGQLRRTSDGQPTQWYGLLVDIEDRKNVEEALRRTETQLARAAQTATVGELAASIAHEVNQPLAAVVATAHACLRWLSADPPNLVMARQAAERIVRDGKDAGEVVRRVRALFKRAALEMHPVHVTEIIDEVLNLLEREVSKRRVAVMRDLAVGVPARDRGSCPDPAPVVQPLRQCHRRDGVGSAIVRKCCGSHRGRRALTASWLKYETQGWDSRPRSSVRAVLLDKDQWDGHGLGDLPIDRRGASRQALGGTKRRSRHDVLFQIAGCMRDHTMTTDTPMVFVVDDDSRVREALTDLLSSNGLRVQAFDSARTFLDSEKPDAPACLVLDLELPDINGLELQEELASTIAPPIVFITGYGDIPSSVRAMKAGAVEFLSKPFGEEEFLQAINTAIALDRAARLKRSEVAKLQAHYDRLTPREREVLPFVVAGFLNKQTAGDLGTSEITIGVHRGQIMRKMEARSLAELVRMADKLGIPPPRPPV